MNETVRQGCLVLADISGYSAYLAGVELEHSHDILADLLGVVADGLCPPLRLAKLEGDAVFCVTPPRGALDGQTLLGRLSRRTSRSRAAGAQSRCRRAAP